MSTTQNTQASPLRYHANAYRFLFAALRRAQQNLGRVPSPDNEGEQAHITGPELLDGVREYALDQFGLMARTVFHGWSVHSTDDFGRMVFDLIERGEMRKTDSDQLADFCDVFDFEDALENQYQIDVSHVFS
jgi:uncharacterized repeat protein (TIGR04138 family)